ncbi:MAG: serine/threonine protein kinase [Lentisphaeria bacterium]|nr:serine/threonine protein kinase [Lentisphaeria bacterium]NQZ70291.1 serine/threonine protein kinase [Lentisphaeria bacterium]
MPLFVSMCPGCSCEFETSDLHIGRQHICKECGDQCIIPSQRIDPGTVFGDFTIQYPLGVGASGEVHLAKGEDGLKVAVKVLFLEDIEDEVDVARFMREAMFSHALDHPGVIKLYDGGEEHGLHYIAMEYVEGETLDHHLDKFDELSEKDALKIIRDVADVMCYVWNERRLVHRDLKPANIMVSYEGITKVMDLGIAKSFMYDLTQLTDPETIIGSPPYMSPEQCAPGKPLDFRADIYSLGCTLYQLVTGEYPFFADTPMGTVRQQIFEKHKDPREFVPGLSEGLKLLIDRMLGKSVKDRHASWEELIEEIDKLT